MKLAVVFPTLVLAALVASCSSPSGMPPVVAASSGNLLTNREVRRPAGPIREFHGETWFFVSGKTATACIPYTYYLESPRKIKVLPNLRTPISTDLLVATLGRPDKIAGGIWYYYGSDQGALLSPH